MERAFSSGVERPKQSRRRVLLTGKLAFLGDSVTADCTVRNLSDDGAMISARQVRLPDDPFLIVVKYGAVHEAHTAWREGERCGLAFTRSWSFSGDAPDRMRQLWSALLG
jgi:hypothetical protein